MKFIVVLLALISVSVSANSDKYYPEKFQSAFSTGTWKDVELKSQLFLLLSSYHQRRGNLPDELQNSSCGRDCYRHEMLGYGPARRYLFGDIHLKKDQQGEFYIDEVYCDRAFTNKDFGGKDTLGEMRIPNGEILNCEHTWPQSKFTRKFNEELQKSDLHHLYPSDSRANSTRGNYPFGEVQNGEVPYERCTAAKIGNTSGTSGLHFQPPAYHRGNVARALFYFSVRYQMAISQDQEQFLRKWHAEDAVDEDEINRNQRIYELQGDRNPFIDYPELVKNVADF